MEFRRGQYVFKRRKVNTIKVEVWEKIDVNGGFYVRLVKMGDWMQDIGKEVKDNRYISKKGRICRLIYFNYFYSVYGDM